MSEEKYKILVATHHLFQTGGSETFTFTLIEELKRRGHFVEYFTFHKGEFSDYLEKTLNVGFMSLPNYDLVLANHTSCVRKLWIKGIIIQTCHGIFPDLEQPSQYADAQVSISEEIRDHLAKLGFASLVIHNGVNCEKYKSKRPVSAQLESVLSMVQNQKLNEKIAEACKELNIKYLQANKYIENNFDMPSEINKADLVIGLGRSAYEAMACGRPVIIYDAREYHKQYGKGHHKEEYGDGYLTDVIIKQSLYNNCSGRAFSITFNKDSLKNELLKYNSSDTDFFQKFAKENLNIQKNVTKYLNLFNNIRSNNTKILEKLMIENDKALSRNNKLFLNLFSVHISFNDIIKLLRLKIKKKFL